MRTASTHERDRLARKTERALTVAAVLGVVEIVRRTPRWLLWLAVVPVVTVVLLALTYIVWVMAFLGAVVAWKLGRGVRRGWKERR